MTVRCERCGTVTKLEKHDEEWLCSDCIRCETPRPQDTETDHSGGGA